MDLAERLAFGACRPMLTVVVCSMFVGVIAGAILGPGGLAFACLGAPVLLYFKQVCETDDQGLRITWLEMRCRFYFRMQKIRALINAKRAAPRFGNTLTLAPLRYGRQRRVFRDFLTRSPGYTRCLLKLEEEGS